MASMKEGMMNSGNRRLRRTAILVALLTGVPMAVVHAGPTARALNVTKQNVTSGTYELTAVATSSSPDTHASYTLIVASNAIGYYAIRNFGTLSVNSFSLTGSTSTAMRYCLNQAFQSGSQTRCADGSSSPRITIGAYPTQTTMATALAPGGYLTLSETSTSSVNDVITIAVSRTQIVTNGTRNS